MEHEMPGPFDFRDHVAFNNAAAAIRASAEEQVRIERALGRALLAKLQGHRGDLMAAYQEIGGSDPAVRAILGDLNGEFAKINVAQVKNVAVAAANKPAVAA